jgi:pimeloyl-ACP methyl ester carboxylesterase
MTLVTTYPTLSSALPHARATARRVAGFAAANPRLAVGAALVAGLATSAVINQRAARKAERDNPPLGRFLTVDGVKLHYLEQGKGDPLVLLHGNGSMIEDFTSSGLIDLAAERYRVIAFDRPGYGHSDRPRSTIWTADAQADLIRKALQRLNISRAIVLGHSWGASVAVALALRHSDAVKGLVLASGYYYPTPRLDAVMLSVPAVPVIGDIIRTTISPLLGRLIWPQMLRKIFGPRPVPAKFAGFPREMALRSSQIRASAAEAALMLPAAMSHATDYASLSMPVAIIAGADDHLIDTGEQSARLHRDVAQSDFTSLPGQGHMIQQTATTSVMAAIESVGTGAIRKIATIAGEAHAQRPDNANEPAVNLG